MNSEQIIVTGASAGIGTEITRILARKGYSIIMACRNMQKARQVCDDIIKDTGNKNVMVLPVNLSSLGSILDFSETIKERGYRVKALINNAGTMCKEFQTTRDGFETTVGVNYVGAYLLTRLMIPLLSDDGRVINTTSITYKTGSIREGFLSPDPKAHWRFSAYPDSKLAVLLFTLELVERLSDRNISAFAVDPGIVNTDMITMNEWFDPLANLFFRPFIKSARKAAQTAVHLATAKSEQLTGILYADCRPKKITPKVINHPYREKLWNETEKLILNRCEAIDSERLHDYLC